MNLRELVYSKKRISAFPGWVEPEAETGYAWFDAPLEIEGVTEVGFVLHGGCYPQRPNCCLTFELRIGRKPGRKRIPLQRLDWRSFSGGHTNPVRKGWPLSGKRTAPTHLHSFDLNWSETQPDRMVWDELKFAEDVPEQLPDFASVRSYVGNRFGINGVELVVEPVWVYDLFYWGGNDG